MYRINSSALLLFCRDKDLGQLPATTRPLGEKVKTKRKMFVISYSATFKQKTFTKRMIDVSISCSDFTAHHNSRI